MPEAKKQITEWVNLYTDDLVNWALYKTKNQAAAEDCVQETFIAALKSFHRFQGKSSPKTWLFSILKNKITDHFRSKFQQTMVHESDLQINDDSSIMERWFNGNGEWLDNSKPVDWDIDEEKLLDNNDFNQILKLCLELLNEKSYLSIQYKYFEGKEGKIICKELGITPSNFWQLLHRAKLQLRDCIENRWFKDRP